MSSARIYNFITLFLIILAVIAVVVVVILVSQPEEIDVAALPTTIPTATATFTETPTFTSLPPTFTGTPTPSHTPTTTPSITPSITASATITDTPGPTLTPSNTPTPSISPTFTPTLTPTGPTPTYTPSTSPFPFVLRDNAVLYVSNFANPAAECAWQGVGGQVFDLNGNEISNTGFFIHVFNNQQDFGRVRLGTNSLYGAFSGWEIPLDNRVSPQVYFVVLETEAGVQISPRVNVQFPGTCEENVALVNFVQARPF